jgi:glycosyltransferase involved in cell wall biosynthesis
MNKESPLLTTLCIPTFNRKKAVYSLAQYLVSSEINLVTKIIIIDDGSSDGTFEALQEFNSIQNIKILKNETNLGYAYNFLRCFQKSDTKFVIMGTDDDLFYKIGIMDVQRQLQLHSPDFISTSFISSTSSRVNKSSKEINFDGIWDAAKHSPGLIYKRSSIAEVEKNLVNLLQRKNLAAFFYPQIILLTILKAANKLLIYSPIEVSGVHPIAHEKTQLLDGRGDHYHSLSNVVKRHQDFLIFYEELLENSNDANQHFQIKNLLMQHRLSFFDNIEAGIWIADSELINDFRRGGLNKMASYLNPKKYYLYFLKKLKKNS